MDLDEVFKKLLRLIGRCRTNYKLMLQQDIQQLDPLKTSKESLIKVLNRLDFVLYFHVVTAPKSNAFQALKRLQDIKDLDRSTRDAKVFVKGVSKTLADLSHNDLLKWTEGGDIHVRIEAPMDMKDFTTVDEVGSDEQVRKERDFKPKTAAEEIEYINKILADIEKKTECGSDTVIVSEDGPGDDGLEENTTGPLELLSHVDCDILTQAKDSCAHSSVMDSGKVQSGLSSEPDDLFSCTPSFHEGGSTLGVGADHDKNHNIEGTILFVKNESKDSELSPETADATVDIVETIEQSLLESRHHPTRDTVNTYLSGDTDNLNTETSEDVQMSGNNMLGDISNILGNSSDPKVIAQDHITQNSSNDIDEQKHRPDPKNTDDAGEHIMERRGVTEELDKEGGLCVLPSSDQEGNLCETSSQNVLVKHETEKPSDSFQTSVRFCVSKKKMTYSREQITAALSRAQSSGVSIFKMNKLKNVGDTKPVLSLYTMESLIHKPAKVDPKDAEILKLFVQKNGKSYAEWKDTQHLTKVLKNRASTSRKRKAATLPSAVSKTLVVKERERKRSKVLKDKKKKKKKHSMETTDKDDDSEFLGFLDKGPTEKKKSVLNVIESLKVVDSRKTTKSKGKRNVMKANSKQAGTVPSKTLEPPIFSDTESSSGAEMDDDIQELVESLKVESPKKDENYSEVYDACNDNKNSKANALQNTGVKPDEDICLSDSESFCKVSKDIARVHSQSEDDQSLKTLGKLPNVEKVNKHVSVNESGKLDLEVKTKESDCSLLTNVKNENEESEKPLAVEENSKQNSNMKVIFSEQEELKKEMPNLAVCLGDDLDESQGMELLLSELDNTMESNEREALNKDSTQLTTSIQLVESSDFEAMNTESEITKVFHIGCEKAVVSDTKVLNSQYEEKITEGSKENVRPCESVNLLNSENSNSSLPNEVQSSLNVPTKDMTDSSKDKVSLFVKDEIKSDLASEKCSEVPANVVENVPCQQSGENSLVKHDPSKILEHSRTHPYKIHCKTCSVNLQDIAKDKKYSAIVKELLALLTVPGDTVKHNTVEVSCDKMEKEVTKEDESRRETPCQTEAEVLDTGESDTEKESLDIGGADYSEGMETDDDARCTESPEILEKVLLGKYKRKPDGEKSTKLEKSRGKGKVTEVEKGKSSELKSKSHHKKSRKEKSEKALEEERLLKKADKRKEQEKRIRELQEERRRKIQRFGKDSPTPGTGRESLTTPTVEDGSRPITSFPSISTFKIPKKKASQLKPEIPSQSSVVSRRRESSQPQKSGYKSTKFDDERRGERRGYAESSSKFYGDAQARSQNMSRISTKRSTNVERDAENNRGGWYVGQDNNQDVPSSPAVDDYIDDSPGNSPAYPGNWESVPSEGDTRSQQNSRQLNRIKLDNRSSADSWKAADNEKHTGNHRNRDMNRNKSNDAYPGNWVEVKSVPDSNKESQRLKPSPASSGISVSRGDNKDLSKIPSSGAAAYENQPLAREVLSNTSPRTLNNENVYPGKWLTVKESDVLESTKGNLRKDQSNQSHSRSTILDSNVPSGEGMNCERTQFKDLSRVRNNLAEADDKENRQLRNQSSQVCPTKDKSQLSDHSATNAPKEPSKSTDCRDAEESYTEVGDDNDDDDDDDNVDKSKFKMIRDVNFKNIDKKQRLKVYENRKRAYYEAKKRFYKMHKNESEKEKSPEYRELLLRRNEYYDLKFYLYQEKMKEHEKKKLLKSNSLEKCSVQETTLELRKSSKSTSPPRESRQVNDGREHFQGTEIEPYSPSGYPIIQDGEDTPQNMHVESECRVEKETSYSVTADYQVGTVDVESCNRPALPPPPLPDPKLLFAAGMLSDSFSFPLDTSGLNVGRQEDNDASLLATFGICAEDCKTYTNDHTSVSDSRLHGESQYVTSKEKSSISEIFIEYDENIQSVRGTVASLISKARKARTPLQTNVNSVRSTVTEFLGKLEGSLCSQNQIPQDEMAMRVGEYTQRQPGCQEPDWTSSGVSRFECVPERTKFSQSSDKPSITELLSRELGESSYWETSASPTETPEEDPFVDYGLPIILKRHEPYEQTLRKLQDDVDDIFSAQSHHYRQTSYWEEEEENAQEDDVSKTPLAQPIVDKCKGFPLVGLQYVLEVRKDDEKVESCFYICTVCSKKMNSTTLVAHVKSVPHRLKYSESHLPDIFAKFGNINLKEWTAVLVKEFTALLAKAESEAGRKQLAVAKENDMASVLATLKETLEETAKNIKEESSKEVKEVKKDVQQSAKKDVKVEQKVDVKVEQKVEPKKAEEVKKESKPIAKVGDKKTPAPDASKKPEKKESPERKINPGVFSVAAALAAAQKISAPKDGGKAAAPAKSTASTKTPTTAVTTNATTTPTDTSSQSSGKLAPKPAKSQGPLSNIVAQSLKNKTKLSNTAANKGPESKADAMKLDGVEDQSSNSGRNTRWDPKSEGNQKGDDASATADRQDLEGLKAKNEGAGFMKRNFRPGHNTRRRSNSQTPPNSPADRGKENTSTFRKSPPIRKRRSISPRRRSPKRRRSRSPGGRRSRERLHPSPGRERDRSRRDYGVERKRHRSRSLSPNPQRSRSPGPYYRHRGSPNRDDRRHRPSPPRKRESSEERHKRIEKRILKEFWDAENEKRKEHKKLQEKFMKTPESHPSYNSEWKVFWENRYHELEAQGKDPVRHDYKSEWAVFWHKKMKVLGEMEWKKNREGLLLRFNIPDPDLVENRDVSLDRKYENGNAPPHYGNVPPHYGGEVSRIDRCHSPWENDNSSNREAKNPSPPRASKAAAAKEIKAVYEEEFSILGTLKLLNELEDQLGSFGIAMKSLYEKASESKKKGGDPMELFKDSDNVVLLRYAREKLSSQISAGILGSITLNRTQMAVERAMWLQSEAEKMSSKGKYLGLDINTISKATMGMDTIQIAQVIAQHLLQAGKANASEDDLQNILIAVSAAHTKILVDQASKAQESNSSNKMSGNLNTPPGSGGNVFQTSSQALFPSGVPSDDQTATPMEIQNEDDEDSKDGKSSSALSLLQAAYDDDDGLKDMDKLSLEDLQGLLANFRNLSREEQQTLTSYLKKLEATDSKKVTKLRERIQKSSSRPCDKSSPKPSVSSQVFVSAAEAIRGYMENKTSLPGPVVSSYLAHSTSVIPGLAQSGNASVNISPSSSASNMPPPSSLAQMRTPTSSHGGLSGKSISSQENILDMRGSPDVSYRNSPHANVEYPRSGSIQEFNESHPRDRSPYSGSTVSSKNNYPGEDISNRDGNIRETPSILGHGSKFSDHGPDMPNHRLGIHGGANISDHSRMSDRGHDDDRFRGANFGDRQSDYPGYEAGRPDDNRTPSDHGPFVPGDESDLPGNKSKVLDSKGDLKNHDPLLGSNKNAPNQGPPKFSDRHNQRSRFSPQNHNFPDQRPSIPNHNRQDAPDQRPDFLSHGPDHGPVFKDQGPNRHEQGPGYSNFPKRGSDIPSQDKSQDMPERHLDFPSRGPGFPDQDPAFRNRDQNSDFPDRMPDFPEQGVDFPNRGPDFSNRHPDFPDQGPNFPDRGPNFPGRGPNFPDRGPNFPNQGPNFPDRGPNFPDRGPNFPDQGPDFSNHGPDFPDRGPDFPDRGPDFPDRGPDFPDRGPDFPNRGPDFPDRGPDFPNRGPNFPDRGPNFPDRGPDFPDRGPDFPDRGPDFPDRGPDFSDRGPNFSDQGPGLSNQGPGPLDRGPGPLDRGPGPLDRGPGPLDRGPGPLDRGPAPLDRGPGPLDRGPGPLDRGPGPLDRGPGPLDRGPAPLDRGPGPLDRGPGSVDRGPGPLDRGPGPLDRGPGPLDRGPGPLDRGPGPLDRGPGPLDRGPGPLDRGPGPLDRGPGLLDRGPGLLDRGPGLLDRGPRFPDRGPEHPNGGPDRGPGHPDRGPEHRDQGPGHPDKGPGHPDLDSGQPDRGPGHPDQDPGNPDRGPGNPDRGPGHPNQGPGFPDRSRDFPDRGPDFLDRGRDFPNRDPGFPERGDRTFPDRGEDLNNRNRDFPDRGRDFPDRGRDIPDRARDFLDRSRDFLERGRDFAARDRDYPDAGYDYQDRDRGYYYDRPREFPDQGFARQDRRPLLPDPRRDDRDPYGYPDDRCRLGDHYDRDYGSYDYDRPLDRMISRDYGHRHASDSDRYMDDDRHRGPNPYDRAPEPYDDYGPYPEDYMDRNPPSGERGGYRPPRGRGRGGMTRR